MMSSSYLVCVGVCQTCSCVISVWRGLGDSNLVSRIPSLGDFQSSPSPSLSNVTTPRRWALSWLTAYSGKNLDGLSVGSQTPKAKRLLWVY